MSAGKRLGVFARSWFRSAQVDQEFAEELRFHIEREAEANRQAGLPPDAAMRAARLAVGDVGLLREVSRDSRPGEWIRQTFRDMAYGWRTSRKSPGFTVSAVLVFALGIGATTLMFSLVDAALIRPLPFPEPGRLVRVFARSPRSVNTLASFGDVGDWVQQNTSFAALAGVTGATPAAITGASSDALDAVSTQNVTALFFDALNVVPIAGRTFAADETDASRVAVISERLWRNHFHAAPDLIGRQITLGGGAPLTVIGVVPSTVQLFGRPDLWTLMSSALGVGEQARRIHGVDAIARLKATVTLDQARADMAAVADHLARAWPSTNTGWGVAIEPLQATLVSDELRRTSLVLMAGVIFVLMMACGNIANLLLARGLARTDEIALRSALGGARSRLIRQLLAETFLLAVLGGLAGLALALVGVRAAPALLPAGTLPPSVTLQMDRRLVMFAVIGTIVAGLASALVPAWQATRHALSRMIGSGARGTPRGGRIRSLLAVLQIAAAVLLLTGAGLFVRTLGALNAVDAGYRSDRVLTMSLGLPFQRYSAPAAMRRVSETVEAEVGSLPGVRRAAVLSGDLPLDGFGRGQVFQIAGASPIDFSHQPVAQFLLVGAGYFDVLGIPILQGRAFTADDSATSAPVCIVSESFVRQYLQGHDPLITTLTIPSMVFRIADSVPVTREIVGVARQVRVRAGETEARPQIYVPFAQNPWNPIKLVLQSDVEPASLTTPIRRMVAQFDKNITVSDVRTMDDVATAATANPRLRAELLSGFAALAISIAAVGLFSIINFMVRQRTREFSIRRALGARRGDVVRLVIGHGARVGVLGLVLGFAVALGSMRALTTLLFGVSPFDPIAFGAASAGVGVLIVIACAAPAALAMRSDPAATLRQE